MARRLLARRRRWQSSCWRSFRSLLRAGSIRETSRRFGLARETLIVISAVTLLGSGTLKSESIGPIPAASASSPWFTLHLPPLSIPSIALSPRTVKAIYLTSWSAGVPARITQAITLVKETELNAIVIDLKDATGKVAFQTSSPLIQRIGSEENRFGDLRELVTRLHDAGTYVIVRIAAFQDQHLVRVRPDLAVRDSAGNIWRDHKGLSWVDPASKEVWEYIAEVAREAAKAGVDELNFDYARFPSDGRLDTIHYPVFDERQQSKRLVIRRLFAFLAETLGPLGKTLSVDLFGLTTVKSDDLGIGQVLEDALLYFDFVSPMVYPSHYAVGFLQYRNPAAYPYEVIHYSLATALERRARFAQEVATLSRGNLSEDLPGSLTPPVKIGHFRPWLQAFDLGAPYPPPVIRKEMQAVYDVGLSYGWYLWNPSNVYDPGSFERQKKPTLITTARP